MRANVSSPRREGTPVVRGATGVPAPRACALPDALRPLRERAAAWAGVEPAALGNALVAEYRPGTPLGWHRDVPDYERVIGISLGGEARMRLRRYPPLAPRKAEVLSLALAPRSVYLLRDEARWGWQHSIAPTPALRWSITFRTLRG
jgi:alkylated DNA repair dioxygenase AlkB